MQATINTEFESVDPVEDVMMNLFDIDPIQTKWFITSTEIQRIVDDALKGTSAVHARSIAAILKKSGVVMSRARMNGKQPRGYCGIRLRKQGGSRDRR